MSYKYTIDKSGLDLSTNDDTFEPFAIIAGHKIPFSGLDELLCLAGLAEYKNIIIAEYGEDGEDVWDEIQPRIALVSWEDEYTSTRNFD